jgi:hypothetical protein
VSPHKTQTDCLDLEIDRGERRGEGGVKKQQGAGSFEVLVFSLFKFLAEVQEMPPPDLKGEGKR